MGDSEKAERLMEAPGGLSLGQGGQTGVLLIHGFTSTPLSVAALGRALAEAGYRVEVPLLAGHGTSWQDLARTSHAQWLDDVERAYGGLGQECAKVFVAGLSMGGALALHLAQGHPELAGVVAINHAIFLKPDWRLPFLPLFKYLVPFVEEIGSDIKKQGVKELTYSKTPTKAVHELVKLLRPIRAGLERVAQPCLIFKSREDHVIPVECAEETYERISSQDKRLVWLEDSYHVATQDNDLELIARETLEFLGARG